MCGRFVSVSPPDEIARYFSAELNESLTERSPEPSYNVAPTDDVYVVYETGDTRRIDAFHWGLVPWWSKDPSTGSRMINARAEGVADKGAYREAYLKRRCIIPADGFYEWAKVPDQKRKQPYFVHRPDGDPMALAGLWEEWRPDRSRPERMRSCTVVTTSANDTMAEIHDRMPVILPPGAWDTWLQSAGDDLEPLGRLLVPAPPELITMHPVGIEVGNVKEAGPQLIEPVDPPPPQPQQPRLIR